ncbi:hypothetical protein BJ322DRAFT_1070503 [Thelephora terrestris]|uniref:Uncharacterized protein n=1 Tax=Thelephora terrestris TaxID=56493 RepID=A0A9P6HB95_9AGAM|nr:hypothetical protein BJ322DRAFT_1070503 [Thelephora terrestris]
MGHVLGGKHLYRIAQIFSSLHEALRELDEFFDGLENQDLELIKLKGEPHPLFFPHHTTFTDYRSKATEFEYLRPLILSTKSPVLVELKSSGQMAVVKFVVRYGAGAHQLLAEAGMAPRLLFCGSTDGRDDVRNTAKESTSENAFGRSIAHGRHRTHQRDRHGRFRGVRFTQRHPYQGQEDEKLHESDYVSATCVHLTSCVRNGKAFLIDFG